MYDLIIPETYVPINKYRKNALSTFLHTTLSVVHKFYNTFTMTVVDFLKNVEFSPLTFVLPVWKQAES